MKRISKQILLQNSQKFRHKILGWAQQSEVFFWLDSNNHKGKYSSYDAVLAVGIKKILQCDCSNAFAKLKQFQKEINDYIFGYLGYDLKNDIEDLTSHNKDELRFPDLYFFQPKKLFFFKGNTLSIHYLAEYQNAIHNDLTMIKEFKSKRQEVRTPKKIDIKQRISRTEYDKKLKTILEHIHRGDIYELNFCQEFYAENTSIHPLDIYQNLNKISSPPFATFFKINDKYLISASPERFVKKEKNKIISQPIKGTARRLEDATEDRRIAKKLFNDPKERSENIMIVDLVRNDLSKTALKGSVKVEELYKVYTFKQVHQLISTVTSRVSEKENVIDIIKSMFPMGSMTGAPKLSSMKIIEKEEETKRGLYSGAVGYFTPENDFDFNVVIRSILYNKTKKYVSFTVGGAITSKSIITNEYEECMVKAGAMLKALNNGNNF